MALRDRAQRVLLNCASTAVLGLLAGATGDTAAAVESAAGFYLLGTKTSLAGVTPPPGVYLQDVKYLYSGSTSGALQISGIAAADVDGTVYFDLPTLLWVAERKVLGGRVGFGAIVPYGWKDVSVGVDLDLPRLDTELSREFGDSDSHFGDPVATALIGWESGNWHWNLQALLNVPIGFWERRNLTNTGFNRWGVDTTAAVTWLDTRLGWEVSAAAGLTFNFENPETDYKSGTEFHVEWAVVRSFTKDFGVGFVGYHYRQVTGDSGAGARLGDFKGRVTGIGPLVNYNFTLGSVPVSTSWRYFKEVGARNRLEGDVGLLTVTVPLWTPPQQSAMGAMP